jgi:hypothetical protein
MRPFGGMIPLLRLTWICVLLAVWPGLVHSVVLPHLQGGASNLALHDHAPGGPQFAKVDPHHPSIPDQADCQFSGSCCGFWTGESLDHANASTRLEPEWLSEAPSPVLRVPKPPPKTFFV